MDALVSEVKKQLRRAGSAETRESGARFFKEKVKLHGVKSTEVRKIAKAGLVRLKKEGRTKEEIFALCGELLQSGYIEEAGVAFEWAYACRKEFVPDDMAVFSGWIDRHVGNWATCDTLCNHSVGDLVMMYPELIATVREWASSPSRWKQRAAAVTLIIPARKGLFLKDVFAIADSLLPSADDMVQKGYGWMLKAAGEAYPDKVFEYLVKHREAMPRTAFRYALEKLPKEMRAKAMKL